MSIIIRRPKASSAMRPCTTRPSATTSAGLTPKGAEFRSTRRQRREKTARELVHLIKEAREASHQSNAEIAKCLNEKGFRAPRGGRLSPEATRRILNDIKRLGLGDGPRTVSQALTARHRKTREREAMELEKTSQGGKRVEGTKET